MIRRNICPICGSENPEGSVVCHVCKANLQNLPDDMFPVEPEPTESVMKTAPETDIPDDDKLDLDSPVPSWLQTKLKQTDSEKKADFESYADAIFGIQPSSAPKPARPRKARKTEPVYQPTLGNMMDSPLVEPDGGTEMPESKNFPALKDFSNDRPAKKWDDPKRDPYLRNVREQARRAFPPVVQMPLLWQQDAPLTDDGSNENASKEASGYDSEFLNSVSPTKVMDPETAEEASGSVIQSSGETGESGTAPAITDEYKPDSGSLLSDLMNEINSNSVTPAPQENTARENGTVFFSGGRHEPEESVQIPPEAMPLEEEPISSAAALDQILRGLGYQTEDEIPPSGAEKPLPDVSDEDKKPEETPVVPGLQAQQEDTPAETNSDSNEEPAAAETKIPDKEDTPDEPDIPWDLFGSQDMTLPQSPEDPAFRTFSRSGIPADGENTTYQQRMMSSILGKIIDAENFIPPQKKSGERSVSIMARLFWSFIALGGIILILMTGIADRIKLPELPSAAESKAFYQYVEDVKGNVLVVLDYTPAYSAELDQAADSLITALEKNAEGVSLCSLNPAAMPKTQQILKEHEEIEFAGWWPAGVISIRSNMAAGAVRDQVWLVTSESSSVRNWTEQLAVSDQKRELHVMASGQLEPILRPYLNSGLVTSALSRDRDLLHYGADRIPADKTQIAVLYLAALLPLAWLGGLFAKFLKSDPNYGIKKSKKTDNPQKNPEKGAMNDGRL